MRGRDNRSVEANEGQTRLFPEDIYKSVTRVKKNRLKKIVSSAI